MYKNVELRKLPTDALCEIINILDINDDWKKVMSIIPNNLRDENSIPKYNNEHIRLIEEYAKVNNQKCTEILIDEWGTSGRFRPTLSNLKDIVIKAEIFRAADQIAKMLNEPLPERPTHGPVALITTNVNITQLLQDESMEQRLNNMSTVNMTNSNKLGDGTTRQMRSISDMIRFSDSYTNETTDIKIDPKSESDLSNKTAPLDPMASENLPNFEVMLATKNISQKSTTPMGLDITETGSSLQSYTESSYPSYNTNKTSDIKHDPNDYQHSFPNIEISLEIDSAILQDTNLNHFDYYELKTITGDFSAICEKGPKGLKGKIGSGGFGDVFVGNHPKYGMLAVKKAHKNLPIDIKPDIAMKVFNAEVKYLSQFRHINIVPIIGFSRNGPSPCIVCEYIEGGSLQQKIEAKCLSEIQRITIMVGTAEGLRYLHTSDKPLQKTDDAVLSAVAESDSQNLTKKFVHGDVKTPNILLTKDCVPKLCDFGVAKQYDATFMTSCFMGTSAYMAPEALQGTITQKIDIFSYGIVLLELLTGLKPIVVNNGYNYNIKHYVEENCPDDDITPLLDPVVGSWRKGDHIYTLARKCFEHNWKKRPSIIDVCDTLSNIQNDS